MGHLLRVEARIRRILSLAAAPTKPLTVMIQKALYASGLHGYGTM